MSDCILWPASHVRKSGYGWVMYQGKVTYPHRMVMGFPNGQVGHICHDEAALRGECAGGPDCLHRRCVNPEHLRVMTAVENSEASPHTRVARKFNTHCVHGHEFTPENTIWESKGNGYRGRKCRECHYKRNRDAHARRKANEGVQEMSSIESSTEVV
ncbi:HNH endonuclease [Mycobacterium phage SchoolBus]|uniref:HNH endonuclease n=2 Tax=Corndogvirus TaxID=1623285 RepID=A0A076G9F4_BPMCO|nr:HNH endonuclease [Mycobacterium phage Catdawg]AII28273.1 HNH endonuclease [Mycobacterium phage YungJamal]ATW60514.1 HNH endonuclease [Mycobacterium phage Familton]AVI04062.1 HNH endonuclease [Mycobacterium phage JangDynasty]AVP42686.1 HNH endonuclease [Mycobacterium phage SchoolBus]URM87802.1 HNH endonuclease [Mycobacterium phage Idergollasper]